MYKFCPTLVKKGVLMFHAAARDSDTGTVVQLLSTAGAATRSAVLR